MGVTLNKDGTPRKIGSGKTKGAGSFAKIKWKQLREFIKEDDDILVGRVWLRSVGALNQKKGSRKKLSPTSVTLRKNQSSPSSSVGSAYKPAFNSQIKNPTPPKPEVDDGDDYEPPPLFASIGDIKNY